MADFDFGLVMKQRTQGLVLSPLLRTFLHNADFPEDFSVHFRRGSGDRPADGWFWPSTHPTMSARALYTYLTDPDSLPTEEKEYMNVLALTMGSATHGFIEMCLRVLGIRPPDLNTCQMCTPKKGRKPCSEPGFMDEETGSRGHMDGVLDISSLRYNDIPSIVGFEFKCLHPEVLLTRSDGTPVRAEDVRPGDQVVGWDEAAQGLVSSRVIGAWENGVVPVWTITTREGREIGVTDEHPFLTPRGWVMAKDLGPGDKVKVAFGSSEWHSPDDSPVSDDEAWLIGLMVGDGGLTQASTNVSAADEQVVGHLRRISEEHGCSVVHTGHGLDYRITGHGRGRNSVHPIRDLLAELRGTGSRTKTIPSSIWKGGPSAWAAFLSGYFDADGSVVTRGSYPHLLWTSVNRSLLADAQVMLGYLGVRSSLMRVMSRYNGAPHESWRLLVRDARAVTLAQQTLSLRSAKKDTLAEMAPVHRGDGKWVRATQQGWDTVKTVVVGSPERTIAIEMEHGTHVTAGLVTHNTMSERGIKSLEDMDLEAWKARYPGYYAQNQEYMRLSGLRLIIVIVMGLGWPWTIREIHVPYDPATANLTRDKYLAVRKAVAEGEAPKCCHRAACPMKAVCASETERETSFLMPTPTRRT